LHEWERQKNTLPLCIVYPIPCIPNCSISGIQASAQATIPRVPASPPLTCAWSALLLFNSLNFPLAAVFAAALFHQKSLPRFSTSCLSCDCCIFSILFVIPVCEMLRITPLLLICTISSVCLSAQLASIPALLHISAGAGSFDISSALSGNPALINLLLSVLDLSCEYFPEPQSTRNLLLQPRPVLGRPR